MDLLRYAGEKLAEPWFWGLVLVVGVTINLYGHVLVPWLRGVPPGRAIREEASRRPGLLALSIFVAFLFPFVVALVSGVGTRYAQHEVETRAAFPDDTPDTVLRVDERGAFVQSGARTRALLAAHPAADARALLGDAAWSTVIAAHDNGAPPSEDLVIELAGVHYLVASSSRGDLIDLYFARLAPGSCLAARASPRGP